MSHPTHSRNLIPGTLDWINCITSELLIRPLSRLSSPKVHENRWIFWLALTRARPTRGELHTGYGQRRQDKIGSHQLDRTFLQQAAETQFSGRRLQAKDGIANNFAQSRTMLEAVAGPAANDPDIFRFGWWSNMKF